MCSRYRSQAAVTVFAKIRTAILQALVARLLICRHMPVLLSSCRHSTPPTRRTWDNYTASTLGVQCAGHALSGVVRGDFAVLGLGHFHLQDGRSIYFLSATFVKEWVWLHATLAHNDEETT